MFYTDKAILKRKCHGCLKVIQPGEVCYVEKRIHNGYAIKKNNCLHCAKTYFNGIIKTAKKELKYISKAKKGCVRK